MKITMPCQCRRWLKKNSRRLRIVLFFYKPNVTGPMYRAQLGKHAHSRYQQACIIEKRKMKILCENVTLLQIYLIALPPCM